MTNYVILVMYIELIVSYCIILGIYSIGVIYVPCTYVWPWCHKLYGSVLLLLLLLLLLLY